MTMTHSSSKKPITIACTNSSPIEQPTTFYIGRRRAMVSLGAPGRNPCTYRCRFCYTSASFPNYPSLTPLEIENWLKTRADTYDIIYISGDTDSFAPPRQAEGVELLERVASLKKDVLFTTRALFNSDNLSIINRLAKESKKLSQLLVACISVSQLNFPSLEPKPIPSPSDRIDQLKFLKSSGVTTALTVRPFLPQLPASEYESIVSAGAPGADIIIGGDWYADPAGMLESSIANAVSDLPKLHEPFEVGPLYFSTSDSDTWETHKHEEAVRLVRRFCANAKIPFFMGSESAISYLRSKI